MGVKIIGKHRRDGGAYEYYVFYSNNTWKFSDDRGRSTNVFKIIRDPELGNMFFYKHANDTDYNYWQTDWNSDDEDEINLANAAAKALDEYEASKAIDKMLKEKL